MLVIMLVAAALLRCFVFATVPKNARLVLELPGRLLDWFCRPIIGFFSKSKRRLCTGRMVTQNAAKKNHKKDQGFRCDGISIYQLL